MSWSAESRVTRHGARLLLMLSIAHATAAAAPAGNAYDELRRAIAARWNVAAERVHVAPDSIIDSAIDRGASPRLEREGSDGRFLVRAGERIVWLRAGVLTRVPVATRALTRGERLDEGAMRMETDLRWGRPAPVDTLISGWMVMRAVAVGAPLLPPAIRPAHAVRAGDAVKLVLHRGTIQIELTGRAAGTGAIGDTIAVRTESGVRVNGVISGERLLTLVGSEKAK